MRTASVKSPYNTTKNHEDVLPRRRLRVDIQALRGFAVLSVLLYHADLGIPAAGYLGVDVFFVISGYLITRMISEGMARGDFSFPMFYFRRAKRLLPAAYLVFFLTLLFAPLFLASTEIRDFLYQLFGAITFTANIVLWQQADYFGVQAELKPLLHVWSLSIEEQYYLLLPLTMLFVPRRYWLRVTIGVIVIGLLVIFLRPGRGSSFFLLHARAWELGIGSIGALISPGLRLQGAIQRLFWPSVFTLVILPIWPIGNFHPGVDAVLICFATLVIILRRYEDLDRSYWVRGLARTGDFSYSLYLVHWPIFAFFNNAWVADPAIPIPSAYSLALIALALLLGYLLYRLVEAPIHFARVEQPKRFVGATLLASVFITGFAIAVVHLTDDEKPYDHIRRANFGFSVACDFRAPFEQKAECRNSEAPEILVWGDSYAMHLVTGIADTNKDRGVVQATMSACGPLLGVALYANQGRYTQDWGESCIAFNRSVMDYILATASIETVVLSSAFSYLIDPEHQLLVSSPDGETQQVVAAGRDAALAAVRRTIDAIRQAGKRVVVIAPPPAAGFDPSRCVERLERDLFILGVDNDCHLDSGSYFERNKSLRSFLDEVAEIGDVSVISFDDVLCDERRCLTHMDGTLIYRDAGHLTHDGSQWLANRMGLSRLIEAEAR